MAERRLKRGRRSLDDLAKLDLDDPETLEVLIANNTDPDMREGLRILLRTCPNRPVAMRDTQKRLIRYRRQAEARRRKALKQHVAGTGDSNGADVGRQRDELERLEMRLTEVRERHLALTSDLVNEREVVQALSLFDPVWESLAPRQQSAMGQSP